MRNCFLIKDKNGKEIPRICCICNKCGTAVHRRVYSNEELKRLEQEFFDKDFRKESIY